jgi:hypothetical protein
MRNTWRIEDTCVHNEAYTFSEAGKTVDALCVKVATNDGHAKSYQDAITRIASAR